MSFVEFMTSDLMIKIVDTSTDAPTYGGEYTLLKMTEAIIIGRGMANGTPTVDIQLTDDEGNKFLVMATGGIIEMLGIAVTGKRQRDLN